jgi:hypothetical protein
MQKELILLSGIAASVKAALIALDVMVNNNIFDSG